ncbi:hypothetical protein V2G26_012117 [Clonostachys chloroleuca]
MVPSAWLLLPIRYRHLSRFQFPTPCPCSRLPPNLSSRLPSNLQARVQIAVLESSTFLPLCRGRLQSQDGYLIASLNLLRPVLNQGGQTLNA